MKYFPLVWANLKRRKLRTALTVLTIMVAFTLFGFLAAIKQALTGGVSISGANRLITRHRVSIIQLLPESYKARMERIPGVSGATHFTWFGGAYQDSKQFFPQMPVEPATFLDLHPEFLLPAAQKEAWLRTRTGAIVGKKTAERFGWKPGDRVPIRSNIWPKQDGSFVWEFDIVGIYSGREAGTDTTQLFFRYDYFDEARGGLKGSVGWYAVRVKNPAESAEVALAIDREFENSAAETKTETEGAFAQGFANQVGNISLITASILGAVFFTILLVTGNTMGQAVRERIGELGMLKAIGFSNTQVLLLVLAESTLIAVLGGGLGLLLGWILTSGGDPTGGLLPLFFFPPRDLIFGIVLCVLLGLVTGLLPAWQAMRLRVADALRRI
jgi:putative ABC transport system permease protein